MRRLITPLALLPFALFLAACGTDSMTDPAGGDATDEATDPGTSFVLESSTASTIRFDDGPAVFSVTLENLTPDTGDGGSQVFSPPVLATHRGGAVMYQLGQPASAGLELIAEDGMNQMMVASLESSSDVHAVVQGDAAVAPGASATYSIEAVEKRGKLSMAFMLVNTNDGFAGVSSLPLSSSMGRASYLLYALDAGTEHNTELVTDIPGPCCTGPGSGMDSDDRIHMHPGITGMGDLDPDKWGWEGAVARLTIERMQ